MHKDPKDWPITYSDTQIVWGYKAYTLQYKLIKGMRQLNLP